ncbi:MAG: alpha/beta fold hydrolase [Streptosporangiaceae bacterium]|nr:alpha/beta fold hydrolase [Streptosporangiaceae bacterium]
MRALSGDVPLAIFSSGDPAAPVVLLVHGYPDTHTVWDAVAADLDADHHVVRYDVRGAGRSGCPSKLREYRLDRLADDLFAVAESVSPDRPVHVVGHDWGSIQAWHAVTDPRAEGRIASFTTISGPCLDHVGHWYRRRLARPTFRHLAEALGQSLRSWYIAMFHVPVIAPLLMRLLSVDAVRGIGLYRANMLPRLLRPRHRVAHIPVQLVVLTRDRYLSQALVSADLDQWAPDLRRFVLAATHWSALAKQPHVLAAIIREATLSP